MNSCTTSSKDCIPYNTAELDRSCPVKKRAATRRRLGEQVAVNTRTTGTSFVGKVKGVRQIAEVRIRERVANIVEIQAQVSGHEATEKASRIQAWQGLSDWQLADRFDRADLCYSYRALGGVGSTSLSSRLQDGGKSRHAERGASNVQGAKSSRSLVRTFTRCNWVKVPSA